MLNISISKTQRLLVQRWFCALSLGVTSLFAVMTLASSFMIASLTGMGLFALSLGALYFIQKNHIETQRGNYRKLNLRISKEKKILRIIEKIAKKLHLPLPFIKIKHPGEKVSLSAAVLGFPFAPTLFLSAELITVFQQGMGQHSFEALVAHELSHLKHADPQTDYVLNALRIGLIFCLTIVLMNVFYLSLFSTLFSLAKLSVFLLCSEVTYAGYCRAKEKQADMTALSIVKNPQSVIRFIYDHYLQYLFYGKLVFENQFAGETQIISADAQVAKILKCTHKKLTNKTYINIYKRLQQAQGEQTIAGCFVQAQTWLNTHPTLVERESIIRNGC